MDLGKSLNPGIDVGQIEGGFMMGLGTVTTEQLVRNVETGELLTKGPGHYKIPTVADVPKEFNVTLIENDQGPTSAIFSSKGLFICLIQSGLNIQYSAYIKPLLFSSKGVGEPPICFSSGVVLAIKDAIANYRQDHGNNDWFAMEPPCTPMKIWKAANPWENVTEDLSMIEM